MKRLMLVLSVAVLAAIICRVDSVFLAHEGKPCAKIVIAENADKAARFAARELKHHLDAMTGGDFALVTDAAYAPTAGTIPICVGPNRTPVG